MERLAIPAALLVVLVTVWCHQPEPEPERPWSIQEWVYGQMEEPSHDR